jgi:hypothetical protein
MVKTEVPAPLARLAGEKLHWAPEGRPVHDNPTDEANVPTGVTTILVDVESPGAMAEGFGPGAANTKFGAGAGA